MLAKFFVAIWVLLNNFQCKVSKIFHFQTFCKKKKVIFLQISINLTLNRWMFWKSKAPSVNSHTWALLFTPASPPPSSFHQLTYIHSHILINLKKRVFLGRLARSCSYGGGGGAPCWRFSMLTSKLFDTLLLKKIKVKGLAYIYWNSLLILKFLTTTLF